MTLQVSANGGEGAESHSTWGQDQPGLGSPPLNDVTPFCHRWLAHGSPWPVPPGQKVLSSGMGRGLVCEASRVLSWLSLWVPDPHAILCSSHMQMWLAGLSVDGTQARRAPACPVLHPPVPTTVQPLGRVRGDVGMKKDQRQWLSMAAVGCPTPWSLPALTLVMGVPCGQAGGRGGPC